MNFQVANYNPGIPVEQHDALRGFCAARRVANEVHSRRVNEAARLYAAVLTGQEDPVFIREAMFPRNEVFVAHLMEKYPGIYGDPGGRMLGLRETMSVTDYSALFVDVLDRMYYGFYNAFPIVNKSLVKTHTLRDFRVVSRYLLDGAVTPFTSDDAAAPAPQRAMTGPVPQDGATAALAGKGPALQYAPKLYHAETAVNWRAIINDDLGIFPDLSKRLQIAGNRGVSKFITQQYVDANGPHASLYKAGYRNLVTTPYGAASNNPALSAQGVMDALKVLAAQLDSGGDPIMMGGKMTLFYGPSLVATAANLKKAVEIQLSVEGGNQAGSTGFPSQFLRVENWINNMELVMDPYIPIVCTASGVKNTMWGIMLDPNEQERPAIEVGFLQGYETPQIFQKVPNTQPMGGGVDPMLGDFYTMDQEMKIVGVMGALQVDGRSTVASTGQGS